MKVEVAIVGGGVTGLGIARDLALRGVSVALFEKGDLASGTSGRSHGLLHSGARYAVKDPVSARECAQENKVLKKVAKHVIEDTGGMFVAIEKKDLEYEKAFLDGCKKAGVHVEELSVKESLEREPFLNPNLLASYLVEDAAIDPFRLALANFLDAKNNNAQIYTYTPVRLLREGGEVTGVRILTTGEIVHADITVNATGAWAGKVCMQAGIKLDVKPNKGTLVVVNKRLVNTVLNRLRPPSDGDIIVPHQSTMVLGTTSIYTRTPENVLPTKKEIALILKEGEKLVPLSRKLRVIRAFSGARPLLEGGSGREATRAFIIVDHEENDVGGLVTVTGGKLTTYRLMAEKTSDIVCNKLGVRASCRTDKEELPKVPIRDTIERYEVLEGELWKGGEVICECESVTRSEVERSFKVLAAKTIGDVKRRTRLGMGECQAQSCAYRVADLLVELFGFSASEALNMLKDFLKEQWKYGKILGGIQRAQVEFSKAMYRMVGGLE
ncbi:MAG: FAD-dependent oxidoreductase [Candidatus Jordarchaeales archaeon]